MVCARRLAVCMLTTHAPEERCVPRLPNSTTRTHGHSASWPPTFMLTTAMLTCCCACYYRHLVLAALISLLRWRAQMSMHAPTHTPPGSCAAHGRLHRVREASQIPALGRVATSPARRGAAGRGVRLRLCEAALERVKAAAEMGLRRGTKSIEHWPNKDRLGLLQRGWWARRRREGGEDKLIKRVAHRAGGRGSGRGNRRRVGPTSKCTGSG